MKPFERLEDLDRSARRLRTQSLTLCLLMAAVMIVVISLAFHYTQKGQDKVYVVDSRGALLEAGVVDQGRALEISADWNLRLFHQYFFTLSPSLESIEYNISKALDLSDESAYRLYQDYKEQGYYQSLVRTGAIQTVRIDSTVVDTSTKPYLAKTYFREIILRQSAQVLRRMISSCTLYPVEKSTNNPTGLIIKNLQILVSEDLELKRR